MAKWTYKEYHVRCDGRNCYAELLDCSELVLNSPETRDKEFKRHGWKNVNGKDYCPECKAKMNK